MAPSRGIIGLGEKSGGPFEFLGRFPGNSLSNEISWRRRRRGRRRKGGGRKRDPRVGNGREEEGRLAPQDRPSVTEICETHRALANGASNPIEIAVGRGDSRKGIIRGPPFPRDGRGTKKFEGIVDSSN